MADRRALKNDLCEAIDRHRDEIIDIGEAIWRHPELGFKEARTAALVRERFEQLGLPFKDRLAVTGLRADLDSGREGPTLALLGELDAIALASHPAADPETGAVHACGHNGQIAALLGAAMGLIETEAAQHLAGRLCFIAVPAEECLDLDFRMGLVEQGRIRYLGGKAEMIRLGVFDDVDAAMLIHSGRRYAWPASWNGFVMKRVRFLGRAAHSGLAPEQGVNALHAANVALNALNAQRDTFRDEDSVRVHGIITRGGDVVNVVPDDVGLEIQIRGRTHEAVRDAAMKVDRAMHAGAMALGAEVEVATLPGYMPMENDPDFVPFFENNLGILDPEASLESQGHRGSSTDMGDISRIMPAFHPMAGGWSGAGHSRDFRVADPERAYVMPAKLLAMTAIDLLYGDAGPGRALAAKTPAMTRDEYLQAMEEFSAVRRYGEPDGAD